MPKGYRISEESLEVRIPDEIQNKDVTFRSAERDTPIAQAAHLSLVIGSFSSLEDAEQAGERWRDVLQRAFAQIRLGADLGGRGPTGVATHAGLEWLQGQFGQRVVNDVHGVMAFECEPWPRFVRTEATADAQKNAENVWNAIAAAARVDTAVPLRERLAYEFYSASVEAPADARFMLLVMAVETLLEPQPREAAVIEHVDRLVSDTKAASLSTDEINSIVGSLGWLRNESIGQAARRLAREKLGDRQYDGQSPAKFITRCYRLRSDLAHGNLPRPEWGEVNYAAGQLEGFVCDLLSAALLNAG
jgi:hypothetical protein